MDSEPSLSLRQAAERLGKSTKQVWRDIRDGKISGVKDDRGHWRIPASAIQTAQQLIETVPVERPLDRQTLAMVIDRAMDQRTQEITQQVMALTHEIRELKQALERSEAKRDQQLIQTIRDTLSKNNQEKSPSRPWWRFGRR